MPCSFLFKFLQMLNTVDNEIFTRLSLGPGSSGKGEFGDWNAFSSPPAPTPPSADLFDLIGSNHTSLTTSQSMTFSMCGSQSVGAANTGLPISRSQVRVAHRLPSHYTSQCYRWRCLIITEDVYVVNTKKDVCCVVVG